MSEQSFRPLDCSPSGVAPTHNGYPALADMSPTERFNELAFFFQSPEQVAAHLTEEAEQLLVEAQLFGPHLNEADLRIETITPESWARCIDPEKPTLGLRQSFPGGAALLAIAAQRLRAQGEGICNVVILPALAYSREGYTDQYFAERGILFDAAGTAYIGDFPASQRIDAFPAHGNEGLWDKKPVGTYINAPVLEEDLGHKTAVQERLASTDIPHAKALISGVTAHDPTLEQTLTACMQKGEAVVIKPTSESLGRGVIMIDPAMHSVAEIMHQLRNQPMRQAESRYMLERWIRCYPLAHPETGVPLDWNVRAYLVDGHCIGAYARLGSLGDAVNISRGAERAHLEEIFDRCKLSPEAREQVHTKLAKLYDQIAETLPEAGIMGLDIIIDEDLEPILLEGNGERSGGLVSLTILSVPKHAMAPAFEAIRVLHKRLFTNAPATTESIINPQNPVRPEDIMQALHYFDVGEQPERAFQLADALPLISEHLPTPLQETAANFVKLLRYATEMEYPDQTAIESNRLVAQMETRRRLLHGELTEFLAPINMWANTDPSNLHMQQQAATYVRNLLSDSPHTFLEASVMLNAQLPPNAQALGRALLFSLLETVDCSPLALHRSTLTTMLEAATSFYLQPPSKRKFMSLEHLSIDQREIDALGSMPLLLDSFSALARNDYSALCGIIEDQLSLDAINDDLLYRLQNYFNSRDVITEGGQYISFLTSIGLGALLTAYAQLPTLPERMQPHGHSALLKVCKQYIHEAGIADGSPDEETALLLLYTSFYTVTSDMPETTYKLIEQLDRLLFRYGDSRLDYLRDTILEQAEDQKANQSFGQEFLGH